MLFKIVAARYQKKIKNIFQRVHFRLLQHFSICSDVFLAPFPFSLGTTLADKYLQKASNSVQKYLQTAARATDLEMFVWLGIAPADQVERVQTNIFCYQNTIVWSKNPDTFN